MHLGRFNRTNVVEILPVNTAPPPSPTQLSGGCGPDVTLEYSPRSEIDREQSEEKPMNSRVLP